MDVVLSYMPMVWVNVGMSRRGACWYGHNGGCALGFRQVALENFFVVAQ